MEKEFTLGLTGFPAEIRPEPLAVVSKGAIEFLGACLPVGRDHGGIPRDSGLNLPRLDRLQEAGA